MTRRLLSQFFLLLTAYYLLSTSSALAADSIFFEFAPEAWASDRYALTGTSEPVYQVFTTTKTTTLTGLDLWLDNTGSAGTMTLTIFPDDGSATLERTVTVPHLAALPGGYKYHVTLPTPLALQEGKTYSMRIQSSLPGLGIYVADRILVLEHNKNFSSEYSNGAVKIGEALQSFTFKLALYEPETEAVSYNNNGDSITSPDAPPPAATSTQPISVTITNARVVAMTATTATFAWTTNIATDSRVTIRTQLSPLNVYTSAVDPTLELEHTITVTGLTASVNYFADVFSSQGSNIILTTYTIGFRTPAQTATTPPTTVNEPPQTPPQITPPQQQPQTTQPASNQAPTQTGAGQTGSTQGASSANQTEIVSAPGPRSDTTSFSWPASKTPSTVTSYRIDIFDHQKNLERSIVTPATTTSRDIAGLTTGTHTVIVYAETEKGTFEKVAPAKAITIIRRRITLRISVGVTLLGLIGGLFAFSIWKFKKEKTLLPPEEGYNPEAY